MLQAYRPRASVVPAALNLTDCPYAWPYCRQPLYAGAMPLIFNATVLNGLGLTGGLHYISIQSSARSRYIAGMLTSVASDARSSLKATTAEVHALMISALSQTSQGFFSGAAGVQQLPPAIGLTGRRIPADGQLPLT